MSDFTRRGNTVLRSLSCLHAMPGQRADLAAGESLEYEAPAYARLTMVSLERKHLNEALLKQVLKQSDLADVDKQDIFCRTAFF